MVPRTLCTLWTLRTLVTWDPEWMADCLETSCRHLHSGPWLAGQSGLQHGDLAPGWLHEHGGQMKGHRLAKCF